MVTLRKNKGSALTYDEMDQNQVEAAHRVAGSSISEDLSLSGKQSSILVGDDITIASGKTVTLQDSASIDIIPSANLKHMTSTERLYEIGEAVQMIFKRIDNITSYGTTSASSADNHRFNIRSGDFTDFGRLTLVPDCTMSITPKFSDSLIVWELNLQGEPNNENAGFLIAEYNDTTNEWQIIRRPGYEGYNNQTFINQQNTYISVFYDGDNNSTMRMSAFQYFDKPNTTSKKTYGIIFTSTTNNTDYSYRQNRTSSSPQSNNYEVGVSTMKMMEIKQ